MVLMSLPALGVDYKTLQQKNQDLVELYKEKNRKHQQTQHMYDVLKKRVMMGQVHTAASENANHTLQSINAGGPPETVNGMQNMNTHDPSANPNQPSRLAQFDNGVEQLHTHQRSGSSHNGSDVGAMPPPQMIPKRRSREFFYDPFLAYLIRSQRTYLTPHRCIALHLASQ
jgi:protein FAM50